MAVTINGSAGVTTNNGAVYNGLQTDTAKASTSGTSVDFTGIPSWVKRITVMFSGVSTNGNSVKLVQLGDSGGIENTGYLGSATRITATAVGSTSTYTAGLGIESAIATNLLNGQIVISLLTTNTWAMQATLSASEATQVFISSSSKVLSNTLTQIRITTVNGTDTFDAGTINIIYE